MRMPPPVPVRRDSNATAVKPTPPPPPPKLRSASLSQPEGGGESASDPQNKPLSNLLKKGQKRMSSIEYRKSQQMKGGDLRMQQEEGTIPLVIICRDVTKLIPHIFLEKRSCVVQEILVTERTYMKCLTILMTDFQQPLLAVP